MQDLSENFKNNLFFFPLIMKIPKNIKRLCPYCGKHTEHKVASAKKSSPRPLSHGSKYRARKRGLAKGTGNLGRYSKPPITKFKLTGQKQSKKTDLRYECKVCKKKHGQSRGIRSKRFQLV